MADLLLETLRSLRAHKLRFLLTSLGIAWGAFLLTYLTASMEGLSDHFVRELEEAGPKFVVAWPGSVIKNRVGERGARAVELEPEDVERVQRIALVEDAAPDLSLRSQIVRASGRTKLFTVNGIDTRSATIRNLVPDRGRFLSPLDVGRAARVAYLGAVAAERLFPGGSAVGGTLQIESVRFRVVGVNRAKGDQMVGVNGWDDWAVFIPWTTAQRLLLKSEKVHEFLFAPLTRDASWGAIRRVREVLGPHHGFAPDLDTALDFFNVHDILQIVHTLFLGFRIFLVSAGAVTLLVGAVGVMNIMLVVVAERTAEIGLRKAIGARGRDVFLQFLAEAGAVCLLSGLTGAALGVGVTQLVAAVAPPEGPFSSTPILAPFTVFVMVGALAAVGIVAAVVPALRAARIPPADALRS